MPVAAKLPSLHGIAAAVNTRNLMALPAKAHPSEPAMTQPAMASAVVDEGCEVVGAAEGIDDTLKVDDAERLDMAVSDGAPDALAICNSAPDVLAICDGALLGVELSDRPHKPLGQFSSSS